MPYSAGSRKKFIAIGLLLAALTLGTFWQVHNFDFVKYDDDKYVTHNVHVSTGLTLENIRWAFTSVHAANWHPITWVSHMLDVQIFGLNPGPHHLINLLIHGINVLLLFAILNVMTGSLWRSAAVSALFAVHPLHVESVAWVAERKDVLSALFMMLTIGSYIWYTKKRSYARFSAVLVFLVLGLMAKPMLVTVPFVLLLLDYWPLGRISPVQSDESGTEKWAFASIRQVVLEKLPLLALVLISSVITIIAQKQEIVIMEYLPFPVRVANAFISYLSYIGMMFWPTNLSVLYPHPEYVSFGKAMSSAFILLFITVLAVWRSKRQPYLAVGWFWFIGMLIPVIGAIQVGVQALADRYTYLPSIGFFIAVVWTISELCERVRIKAFLSAAILIAAIGACSYLTVGQLKYWTDSYTLFSRALAVTSDNYVMHTNLGASLAQQGKIDEAVEEYKKALAIRHDDLEANYNLGNIYMRQGRMEEAAQHFGKALNKNENYAPALNNLGIVLASAGNHEVALAAFQKACRLQPDNPEFRDNLNRALAQRRVSETQSIKIAAPVGKASSSREAVQAGVAMVEKGNINGAISRFKEALTMEPNNFEASAHLAMSLAHANRLDEAITQFREAIRLRSDVPEMYNGLGVALAKKGRFDEAIPILEKALNINPNFAKAHNSLGVILAQQGKLDDASMHLQKALQIEPDNSETKKNLQIINSLKAKK